MSIRYLNTDLVLVAPRDLTSLGAALEQRGVFALSVDAGDDGRSYASFETTTCFESPEPNILAMLDAIDSLDDAMRDEFSACTSRVFDIGYDCGSEPWAFTQEIGCDALRRMAAAGASLKITLYPETEATSPK
jgi:hypothetical protein